MVKPLEGMGFDMSESDRDEGGRFTEKFTENDILKIFDDADAPFMTAAELADELSVSRSAVNYRLQDMREQGLVGRKKTGSRAVGWWATVAPELSEETIENIAESEGEIERGETVGLDEMKRRLGVDD